MNGLDMLIQDHAKVNKLLQQAAQEKDPSTSKHIVTQIIEELCRHSAVEEEALYPLLLRVTNDEKLVGAALTETEEIKSALAELEKMDASDTNFTKILHKLTDENLAHIEKEEKEVFKVLRDNLKEDELNTLGEVIQKLKMIAPTKPFTGKPISLIAQLEALTRGEEGGIRQLKLRQFDLETKGKTRGKTKGKAPLQGIEVMWDESTNKCFVDLDMAEKMTKASMIDLKEMALKEKEGWSAFEALPLDVAKKGKRKRSSGATD